MARKRYPTREQLKALKEADWRKVHKGLFWQSPYDNYYFSPRQAVAIETRYGSQVETAD